MHFFGCLHLNPGISVNKSEGDWKKEKKSISKPSIDIEKFIISYHQRQRNFANSESYHTDSFDVKQAAFLTPWEDNEIQLPVNPDWENESTRDIAARNVISNKLQLELVPYASASFEINPSGDIKLLFPYIDTLLDEIFSKERKYIIFASSKFEKIFRLYNKECKEIFDLSNPVSQTEEPLKEGGSLHGQCKVIHIKHNGETRKALIAHTFPSQAIGRAYSLMQKYGEFCYSEYTLSKNSASIRIDPELKSLFDQTCNRLGLSAEIAIENFIKEVIQHGKIPCCTEISY